MASLSRPVRVVGRALVVALAAAFLACGALALGLSALIVIGQLTSQTLTSDMHFTLECEDGSAASVDARFEAFLVERGFSVVSRARVARQYGEETIMLADDIVGVDEGERRISLHRALMLGRPTVRSVSLTTEPPTRRADELERALLQVAHDMPECGVQDLVRRENEAAAAGLHRTVNEDTRSLLRRFPDEDGPARSSKARPE